MAAAWVHEQTNPYFDSLTARHALFTDSPIETLTITSSADFEVPSGVETFSSFARVHSNTANIIFTTVNGQSSIISFSPSFRNKPMFISGFTQFSSNSLGRRAANVNLYSASSILQEGATLISVVPATVAVAIIPFSAVINVQRNSSITHLKFSVFQDSGSTVTSIFTRVSIMGIG